MIIAKDFDFHASHILPDHRGACSRLHGHTYKLRIAVSGDPQPVDGRSTGGMVTDFGVLKRVYKLKIEPVVEHQDLNETLVDPGTIPASTCEHIALWIARVVAYDLAQLSDEANPSGRVRFEYVQLWETPTSFALVSHEDLMTLGRDSFRAASQGALLP